MNQLARKLQARQWRLGVAESATGGLLGHQITSVSGSSRYFWGGVIAYADDVKVGVLGVREESLKRWGAVSAPVALEMAQGVCRALGVEVAVSITGIAGPTGATATKPLGLYYIGLAVPGDAWSWRHHFEGDRQGNNERAANAALQHLLDYLH
ncbi:MAG: CinA family protein [Anaerolineae bacterium]